MRLKPLLWNGCWNSGCFFLLLATSIFAEDQQQEIDPHRKSIRWESTTEIPAPEAFQAAAADEQFLYAIANQVVSKYSRATGERIAISTGPAEHLNSGFFWKGNLYCAHSNYPQKPEHSQIKVLSVETMELSTFKDFANPEGSLTWVLRDDQHWWCNFAYYGEENSKTVLIQFDEAWVEQRRWTYPMELIRQLGKYSLSGGIWRQGELCVTGHDDPILYRLRLPGNGQVLEFVDQQQVPFTGQGIAVDPVTAGLIGIHRPQRKMILATPKQPQ